MAQNHLNTFNLSKKKGKSIQVLTKTRSKRQSLLLTKTRPLIEYKYWILVYKCLRQARSLNHAFGVFGISSLTYILVPYTVLVPYTRIWYYR
jgi:hypothetical protein